MIDAAVVHNAGVADVDDDDFYHFAERHADDHPGDYLDPATTAALENELFAIVEAAAG